MRGRTQAKLGLLPLVALACSLLAVGCGGGSSSGGGTGASTEATAKPGGVLHSAVISEPPSLLPLVAEEQPAADVDAQIFETLLKLNESGKIEPLLASSYHHSPDGLEWTFKLRHGVKFSDGKDFTANDVAFTVDADRKSALLSGVFAPVSSVTAPKADVVKIKTSKPMAALPAVLGGAVIMPANFDGMSEEEFGQKPIGTGPFELKKWTHGQSLTLSKNPNYWRPNEPLADEIVFSIIGDEQSRLAQFRGGQIDFMPDTSFSDLNSLEQTPGIEVRNYGMYRYDYLGLNLGKSLFANRHAREAVNLAIDRVGVNKAAIAGFGEPAGSFIPPTLPYHASLPIQAQEVSKAKALLASAEEEGVNPDFDLAVLAGEAYAGVAGQIIQQNLDEVGFKVALKPLDVAALYEEYFSGELDAALAGFYFAVQDPVEPASFYLEQTAPPNGVDTTEMDKRAEEGSVALDTKERQAIYTQLQNEVQDELQAVPIDYQPQIWLSHDNIAGLEINSGGIPYLGSTGFAE